MGTDFDKWNEIKKKLNSSNPSFSLFPKPGEVWTCILGKNIGSEQNGGLGNFSRPVLIVKKFNNQIFLTVPLTAKQKNLDFYYNFIDPRDRQVSVILAQLRLLSIKRFKRKLYSFPERSFRDIRIELRRFMS